MSTTSYRDRPPLPRARRLLRKHALAIGLPMCLSLLLLGLTEMVFSYREAVARLGDSQEARAKEIAGAVRRALGAVERQVAAVSALPWHVEGWLSLEDRRREYQRLLLVAPSVESLKFVDRDGTERLAVSRRDVDRIAHLPGEPPAPREGGAAGLECIYGRVAYANDYAPYLALEMARADRSEGRTVANINLLALAGEIRTELAPANDEAYVVDPRLMQVVLHAQTTAMLERRSVARLRHVDAESARRGMRSFDRRHARVIASTLKLPELGWLVVVEQPEAVALAPAVDTLRRTAYFVAAGLLLAVVTATLLARRITRPVAALHQGAAALAEGRLETRIAVATGDELQDLADRFNSMAGHLQESRAGLEARVAERTHAAEEANRLKSEFLAYMSHELRTPLNAVLGFSEALQEELFGPLNRKQQEYVEDIHASGTYLLLLINDVLDLAKVESGNPVLEPSTFDVTALLQRSVALVRERFQHQAIRLHVDIAPEVTTWTADERRFKQVLVNLLANASKFTPRGGDVTLRAGIDAGVGLWLSVGNTGEGIAPEDQQRIFEKFGRAGNRTTRQAEGTGLGLMLSRRFVQLHGGQLTVESQPGQGATFRFNIPGQIT